MRNFFKNPIGTAKEMATVKVQSNLTYQNSSVKIEMSKVWMNLKLYFSRMQRENSISSFAKNLICQSWNSWKMELALDRIQKKCPRELKSINTVLIFILESWDLKTCEYVFDVKTCKQKVAQGTNFCCPFCLSTAIDLYSWKMFQNQTWPVKSMSNQTRQIWTEPYKNDVPNQYFQINEKFNVFSENVIFQIHIEK